MLTTARSVARGSRIETDLCVIGGGPAGMAVAHQLMGSDVRVCLLESGDTGPTLRGHRLATGASVGESYYRLGGARLRALGGASLRFPLDEGWHARPLDPVDFTTRAAVPHSGWPLDRDTLDPHYERAQVLSDLGPYTYDPATWESPAHGRPFPLDPRLVETTMFQLGTTNFGRLREPLERAPNVNVVLHATVVDIATDEDPNRVDRVVVARPDGGRFSVHAHRFVLAAGGIENARLLLASNRTHPRGLGNGHDLVGRFFMERLSTRSGFIDPSGRDVVSAARFYVNQPAGHIRIEGVLRVSEERMVAEGLRNCLFFVLPRTRSFMAESVRSAGTLVKGLQRRPLPADLGGHVRNVVRGWRTLASVAAGRVRGGGHDDMVLLLRAQAEQAPNPESRVTIDRRRDSLGSHRARLEWRTTDDDRASIRRSQEIIGEAFAAAGLGQLALGFGDEDPPAMFEGNRHHMGTTRMSRSPLSGVVDSNCRLHGIDNLFVAGSSVFSTSGSSNPTLTIVALALRLADHLRDLHDRRSTPGGSQTHQDG